jgi:hypothetical protein
MLLRDYVCLWWTVCRDVGEWWCRKKRKLREKTSWLVARKTHQNESTHHSQLIILFVCVWEQQFEARATLTSHSSSLSHSFMFIFNQKRVCCVVLCWKWPLNWTERLKKSGNQINTEREERCEEWNQLNTKIPLRMERKNTSKRHFTHRENFIWVQNS